MTITKDQTAKMKARLEEAYGDKVVVDFCMRYGNPSTKSKVDELVAQGCTKILFFPLYPQYAGATSATACDEFFRALQNIKWQPDRAHGGALLRASALYRGARPIGRAHLCRAGKPPDVLVASYHGVPKRYLMEGDPYHCQCQKTSRLLKERLGWADTEIVTTFQSRFGPEEWLKPYTVEEVARLAEQGKKRIAVVAPAFSADCIETLEEINEEIRESFEEAGGEEFTYIPCLNDDDAHIDALATVVSREPERLDLGHRSAGGSPCCGARTRAPGVRCRTVRPHARSRTRSRVSSRKCPERQRRFPEVSSSAQPFPPS
jgi:ferrochelatase